MEEFNNDFKKFIIKIIKNGREQKRDYSLEINDSYLFNELKRIIQNKSHLINNNYKILYNGEDLINNYDNISLKQLFPKIKKINLYVIVKNDTNKRKLHSKNYNYYLQLNGKYKNKNFKYFTFKLLIIVFIFYLQEYNNCKFPKVCIFMPIFNKEQYLKESIQSIQNQTLKQIEIIAVNDFSSDNSIKILKKLSKIDKRIKIVNNDRNHGLLYSRAMGIINCTGEYVINLDPDDQFSSPNNLKILYNKAKRFNIDTIIYLIKLIEQNHNNKIILTNHKLNQLNKSNYIKVFDYFITNKFIKREVILKCFNIFKEKIYKNKWNFHEDNVWSILIHKYSKSIKYFNNVIYLYLRNKESLMNKFVNILELKNIIYRFEIIQKIFKYKDIFHLNIFLSLIQYYYKNIIKKDIEIRKKIINNLNNFIFKNINNLYINKVQYIKNLLSNNKIIIINRLYDENIENNILYLTIYNFIKNYIGKNIIIVNGKNKKELIKIINYVNIEDILVVFDKILYKYYIEYLIQIFPNNKILLFTENFYIINKIENNYSNNINIKKYILKKNKKKVKFNYNQNYIKDYLIYLSNFFNYKKYKTNNNILVLFNEKQTNNNKEIIINIISKNIVGDITFLDDLSSKKINQKNKYLINLLTKYKIVITDNINIMKISAINYISCIFISKDNYLNLNDNIKNNIKNFDYIKYIHSINELEINIIEIKNKYIIQKDIIKNNSFFLLENEFKAI